MKHICSVKRASRRDSRNLSSQNDPKNSSTHSAYEDDIKRKILESSLPFVVKHGWTTAAINDGAVSIGYPGIIHGVFTNPGVELIDYFNKKCNRELSDALQALLLVSDGVPDTQKFIGNALKLRLQKIIPYIEKWPQALALMSLPANIPTALQTFSMLIDDICYHSGDKSVDFNWYSRRLAVGVIYKATELCMIQDKTVDFVQTWTFLERRIEEAFSMNKILLANVDARNKMKDIGVASFTILRNILGSNHASR